MQYQHSVLHFRYKLFADAADYPNPDVDEHMQRFADAGFELITVTERSRDGGPHTEVTRTFYWRRHIVAN